MFIYFASSPSKQHFKLLIEEKVRNILVSYHYLKKPSELIKLLNGYEPERIIIDSGAFSVWSNGGIIDLEDYANFCVDLKKLLSSNIELNIVNLDVLPGKWGFVPSQEEIDKSADKGWENMLYLESRGLKVIHVFHQHEHWEVLDKLTKHSDYIGISPANDVSNVEKEKWMNQVFARIKDSVKTHGFAVTSYNQLYKYPYYSADSSSWITPARFGMLPIMTNQFQIKSFSYKDINQIEKYWKYLSDVGIDVIADSKFWQGRTRIAIETYKQLEVVASKVWKNRGIDWNK